MSATETTLRRSGRERTQTKVYVAREHIISTRIITLSSLFSVVTARISKRKRAESSDDERDDDDQYGHESSSDESDAVNDDDEVEFPDPRPRKKPTAKSTRTTPAAKAPAAKRPRGAPAGRRRKPSAFDTVAATKDASISDDNALFSEYLGSCVVRVPIDCWIRADASSSSLKMPS